MMKNAFFKYGLLPFCLVVFLLSGSAVVFPADDTPDLPPPGAGADVLEAKVRESAEKDLLATPPPEEVPIEEETPPEKKLTGPNFYVRDFILEGDVVLQPEDYEHVLAQLKDQTISFEQLQKMISDLEQLFRSKGYVAVVLLPPQKMEKSEIRLKVIVSKMGDLTVINNRYYSAWRTRAYWKIKKGAVLDYDRIRKGVLDMNENPDRMVKPILKAGKAKGTSDIVLNVEDKFPIHAGYSLDNQGVKLTGKIRNGFTIKNNNFLGLDDTFLIGTTFGKKDFGVFYMYHVLPVSNFGTKFISSYSHAQVNPKKQYEIYGINSISDTYSLALQQRVIRTDKYSGNIQLGFDFKEKHTRTQSITTVWDKQRVLSLSGNFQARDKWGGWGLSQGVYFGMPNRGDGWPLASRQADHAFFKYTYSLTRVQKLPFDTKAIWVLQGQLTPNRLLPTEQMFLGGAKSVRGYPESDYGADEAIQSRLDYLAPAFFFPKKWKIPYSGGAFREQVDLIGFFDMAYGNVYNPSETEHRRRFLAGVGGGFQIRFRSNLSARFEWGIPVGNDPLTESGNCQFHFTFKVDY